jgi:sulfane dehydrogenase subunit SoxC
MVPRSLMVPPGVPDFFTRARTLTPGPCRLMGRAWSGSAAIRSVDVSIDGGDTWDAAILDSEPSSAGTWIGWSYVWTAQPGDYELCCRATDAEGATQPSRPRWNRGGYANNAIHRVPVRVLSQ